MSFMTKVYTTDVNEAMDIANHNFTAIKKRLHSEDGIVIPDHVGIFREDTNQYLGTVGNGWEPVQPEVIYDMAGDLIEATSGKINGVFNMYKGAVMGISFNLAEREYVPGDKTDINFLMLTSFNGMYGIAGHATTERLACMNQCNTSSKVYNLRHTRFVGNRIQVVKDLLKFYNKEIKDFDKKMMGMVNKRMNEMEAIDWFKSLFPKPKSIRSEARLDNQVDIFINCLRNGLGSDIPGVKGTSYGAFQALTEYINHERSTRIHNDREPEEVRYQSIHFGTGNALAQKGLNKLSEKSIFVELPEDDFLID